MTLEDMKKKTLQLIEEIDNSQKALTSDPDIAAKLNSVINQVQFELCRMKKIAAYVTRSVLKDEVLHLENLDNFYQLKKMVFTNVAGDIARYELFENIAIFPEDGSVKVYYYKYPEVIDDKTKDTYVFELSQDALEIMPYGVAADLLKSDVSTGYGQIYQQRYEQMLQRLDSRNSMGSFFVEGGASI